MKQKLRVRGCRRDRKEASLSMSWLQRKKAAPRCQGADPRIQITAVPRTKITTAVVERSARQ